MNSTTTNANMAESIFIYVIPIISQLIIACFIFVFEYFKKKNHSKFLELIKQENTEAIEKLSNEVKSLNCTPSLEQVSIHEHETYEPYPSPKNNVNIDQLTKKIRLGDYIITFESTPR